MSIMTSKVLIDAVICKHTGGRACASAGGDGVKVTKPGPGSGPGFFLADAFPNNNVGGRRKRAGERRASHLTKPLILIPLPPTSLLVVNYLLYPGTAF